MRQRRLSRNWKTALIVAVGALFCAGIVYKAFKKKIQQPIVTEYSVEDPAFRESISHLLGPPLTEGNRVEELVNGVNIFPAMLRAIRGAQKTISLETYIWKSGKLSDELITALSERARAGVKVHCLADGLGCIGMKIEDMNRLKQSGARFVVYARDRWYKIKPNVNHRTHRKLLIIDGRVGFTGGACLADDWLGNADSPKLWRDTHYRLEGPAVKQMQGIFVENWLQTTGEVLEGPDYFPIDVRPAGSCLAQCFKTSPKDEKESGRLVHLFSIAAARKNVRLGHAYFVPDKLAVQTLLDARKRGVSIEVIVPARNDSAIGRAASRSRWQKLAEAGVKFYAYEPALYHCKVMIVDDVWVSAGSMNFDDRSFQLNDEANFNVLNQAFAAAQTRVFEEDKAKSRLITATELSERPWVQKLADYCAGALRSQL